MALPSNRARRTRKDILRAAARLMRRGLRPNLDEIAEEAMVSRATAYRYFPGLEALLLEAGLDLAMPEADSLFPPDAATDPAARLETLQAAVHDMILANEAALRMVLIQSLGHVLHSRADQAPSRQNRRTPLIEAALAPAQAEFDPVSLRMLTRSLAFFIGTEGMVVAKDVLQIDDSEARAVARWAIHALVEHAKKPGRTAG